MHRRGLVKFNDPVASATDWSKHSIDLGNIKNFGIADFRTLQTVIINCLRTWNVQYIFFNVSCETYTAPYKHWNDASNWYKLTAAMNINQILFMVHTVESVT
jgi:hypothetical protein